MAKQPINLRLDADLIDAADALAAAIGTDRTELIARGLRRELLHEGGREFIYVLRDEAGEVRYVGRSSDPYRRLREHIAAARAGGTSAKEAWLAGLLAKGGSPRLAIIDDGDADEIAELEAAWIEHFHDGGKLTNGRFKGQPTKVVRLPVALLEPLEAEASRTGKPIAEVLASRLRATPAAAQSATAPSASRSSPRTKATARRPAAATMDDPARGLNENGHLRFCKCPMCGPPKGAKR